MDRRGLLAAALGLAVLAAGVVVLRVAADRREPATASLMPSVPGISAAGHRLDTGPGEAERIRTAELSARNLAEGPYRPAFGPGASDPEAAAGHLHAALEAARATQRGGSPGVVEHDPSLEAFEMPRGVQP